MNMCKELNVRGSSGDLVAIVWLYKTPNGKVYHVVPENSMSPLCGCATSSYMAEEALDLWQTSIKTEGASFIGNICANCLNCLWSNPETHFNVRNLREALSMLRMDMVGELESKEPTPVTTDKEPEDDAKVYFVAALEDGSYDDVIGSPMTLSQAREQAREWVLDGTCTMAVVAKAVEIVEITSRVVSTRLKG